MQFLFWNICGGPVQDRIAQMVIDRDIDVIVLAEARSQTNKILSALNSPLKADFYALDSPGCERISIFSKYDENFTQVRYETSRISIREFSLPGIDSFLLASVHMPSKREAMHGDQAGHCEDLAQAIVEVEDNVAHTRTILVGDINQNPFEEGLVSAKGLHAVMSADIARRNTRIFNGKEYRFFYNPMWGMFSDCKGSPPGTFFYNIANKCQFFWHMLDQVLIRPSLIPRFESDSLEIVTSDSLGSLLDRKGRPSKRIASDHLPIVFKISI